MKETVINLIAEMIKELREKDGEPSDTAEIYRKLLSNSDISKIVDEFLDHFLEDDDAPLHNPAIFFRNTVHDSSPTLHRIMSQEEHRRFTKEAHGFLTRLFKMKIIDVELQEEIIERSLEISPHLVTLPAIKGIAFYTLSMRNPEFFFNGMSRYFGSDDVTYH